MVKKRDVKGIRAPEVAVKTATPRLETRSEPGRPTDRELRPYLYHPDGEPRPKHYLSRPLQPYFPCDKCDRIKTDGGQRAVVFDAGVNRRLGKAYGRCRCCGVKVVLPIESGY